MAEDKVEFVLREAEGGNRAAGRAFGSALGAMGGGTTGAIVGGNVGDLLQKGLGGLGKFGTVVGVAATTAATALTALYKAADSAAEELSQISGKVATAQAEAEVARLQMLMDRDARIGDQLAELVRLQSQTGLLWEEVKTQLLTTFLPIVQGIMEMVKGILQYVTGQDDEQQDLDAFMEKMIGDFFNPDKVPNVGAPAPPPRPIGVF